MDNELEKQVTDVLFNVIHGGCGSVPKWEQTKKAARAVIEYFRSHTKATSSQSNNINVSLTPEQFDAFIVRVLQGPLDTGQAKLVLEKMGERPTMMLLMQASDFISWCKEETKNLANRDKDFFYMGAGQLFEALTKLSSATHVNNIADHSALYEASKYGQTAEQLTESVRKEEEENGDSFEEQLQMAREAGMSQADWDKQHHSPEGDIPEEIKALIEKVSDRFAARHGRQLFDGYQTDGDLEMAHTEGMTFMYNYLRPLAKVISYLNEIGREAAREARAQVKELEGEKEKLGWEILSLSEKLAASNEKIKELQEWHDSHI